MLTVLTAAGVAIGRDLWPVAASLDLTGQLRASAPAFLTRRAAGAADPISLGVRFAAGPR